MIKLIDLLNEGKQVGILYHFTPLNNLIKIFQSNCLKDRAASGNEVHFNPKSYYVSFTRNKNFDSVAKVFGLRTGINFNNVGCVCMITIDGNKLSNNYSTEPARDVNFSSTSKYLQDFGCWYECQSHQTLDLLLFAVAVRFRLLG